MVTAILIWIIMPKIWNDNTRDCYNTNNCAEIETWQKITARRLNDKKATISGK